MLGLSSPRRYCSAVTRGVRRSRSALDLAEVDVVPLLLGEREDDREDGAAALLGRDGDGAAVAFDDALDDRQAEP